MPTSVHILRSLNLPHRRATDDAGVYRLITMKIDRKAFLGVGGCGAAAAFLHNVLRGRNPARLNRLDPHGIVIAAGVRQHPLTP